MSLVSYIFCRSARSLDFSFSYFICSGHVGLHVAVRLGHSLVHGDFNGDELYLKPPITTPFYDRIRLILFLKNIIGLFNIELSINLDV